MSASGASDWDDEVNKYRRGAANPRQRGASMAGFLPTSAHTHDKPALPTPIIDEDDYDISDDDADLPEPSVFDSKMDYDSQAENNKDINGRLNIDDDDGTNVWTLLQSTTDQDFRIYYNKRTKEVSVQQPAGYIPPTTIPTIGGQLIFDDDASALDRARLYCNYLGEHTDKFSTLVHAVTSNVSDHIMAIKQHITDIHSVLSTIHDIKNTSIVDALVGRESLTWDFSSSRDIDYYRSASLRTNHENHLYKDWTMPQYFSHSALPVHPLKNLIHVSVPSTENHPQSRTTIEFAVDDLVSVGIQKVINKIYRDRSPSLFVFKVLGHEEYLDHNQQFMSYAYIRKCIRDASEIHLLIVQRPEPLPPEELSRCDEHIERYKQSINPNVQLVDKYTYSELNQASLVPYIEFPFLTHIPMSSLHTPFHVHVLGIDNITPSAFPRLTPDITITGIYVRALLFHGTTTLSWEHDTAIYDYRDHITVEEGMYGNARSLICFLPRETRIGYILYARINDNKDKDIPLGWVVSQLVNVQSEMITGPVAHAFWPFPSNKDLKKVKKREYDSGFIYRAQPYENNTTGTEKAYLHIKYPTYNHTVVSPLKSRYSDPNPRVVGHRLQNPLDRQQSILLLQSVQADPLFVLNQETKQLLWTARHYLTDTFSALPKVLQCVDWGRQDFVHEAHRLLQIWKTPTNPIDAIELLDACYADYQVRTYAVGILRNLNDEDLQTFSLQLVQCLKYEPYHESALSRFLIERALQSPYQIGHSFYWHLKAEVHNPAVTERFALILEEFVSYCGIFSEELYKQLQVVNKLQLLASKIVEAKRTYQTPDEDVKVLYTQALNELNKDFFGPLGKFQVPLNPKWEATTLIVEKCRYMSSKMVPLWLVFKNADADAPPICFIFKSGDDLRQDLLTLQLLRVMDTIWLNGGLDMRLKPYNVIATGVNKHGDGVGMIEVVLNSDTTSSIQVKWGGGAMGALRSRPLDEYIRDNNRDATSYKRAVDNFVRSCAGYCVATFVLGIGDRHNGNIMVTRSGHLFHIDFGHFLGNFKKKFGVNRERAAFVFTPEMAYVMGGEKYKKSGTFLDFKKMCSRCFKQLRQHASLLENLFILMVAAGMPELLQVQDIHYLRDKLLLHLDTKAASKELQAELKKSLDSTYRRIDNMIHNVKHGG